MRHPSMRALHAYWNSLRGQRAAPSRTDIDPRALARELGDIFLLEGEPSAMRFRLAGSRIVHAMGDSLTGKAFEDLWDNSARTGMIEALTSVSMNHEPMLLGIRLPEPGPAPKPATPQAPSYRPSSWLNLRPQPGPRIERRLPEGAAGEMLLLPLTHAPRQGMRVLGALALFEPPVLPRAEPGRLFLSGGRMLGRETQPQRGSNLLTGAAADQVVSRHGHLVLLRGARDDQKLQPNQHV